MVTTVPLARSGLMPPTAAVRTTVVHPAAMPVRRGWTTSFSSMPSYRWQRPAKISTRCAPMVTDHPLAWCPVAV